jgi:hypothetical protein
MVTPQPAQVEVPVWITGVAPGEIWDSRISLVATRPDELPSTSFVLPAVDDLSGELDSDRALVIGWADAGASHLLLRPPEDWDPDDLRTVSRHLTPEVAMVGFPSVIVTAPLPQHWPTHHDDLPMRGMP